MSATKLVLHHRYRDDLAYDWSRNNNHGHLVGVHTGSATGSSNALLFSGGEQRVEVRRSPSLRDFGELRIRVVFRAEPEMPLRRYNLVEGELAFALFREPDGSLHGTINSPTGGWTGPQSAPGVVKLNTWHVADYVHDGTSHARLFLDQTLVAERWDEVGPIPNLAPQGILIGYWPGGDDRYTLRGQIAEVQIWKDDPRREVGNAIDECCVDKDWLDERVREARRVGWTAERSRETLAQFFGLCRAAVAEARGGDPVRTKKMAALTQQGMNALTARDAAGFETALQTLESVLLAALGAPRIQQLGHELWDALRATPLGHWLRGSDAESAAFLHEIVARTCLDGLVPPHRGREPERPPPRPDESFAGDPFTDRDPPPDPPPSGEKPVEPPTDPEDVP